MARSAHVPQFGKWETNVSYTEVFSNTGKGDVQEEEEESVKRGGSASAHGKAGVGSRSVSSDAAVKRGSALENNVGSPNHQRYEGRLGNKPSGSSSPSWEKKCSSDGGKANLPAAAGKSRLGGGGVKREDNATVPVFGDWDEKNPYAGDISVIFTKAVAKKIEGGDLCTPGPQADSVAHEDPKHQPDSGKPKYSRNWGWCFSPSPTD